MIEVGHNPDSLPCKKNFKVPRDRYEEFRRFMDVKRERGLRVRHSYDMLRGRVILETRDAHAMGTAERFLRREYGVRNNGRTGSPR